MEFIHEMIKKDDDLAVKIKILDTDLFKKGMENDLLEGLKHWHRSVELLYIIEGEQYTILNGKKIVNQKGDLLIVNSSLIHACGNNSKRRNICLCLQIDYRMLKKLYKKDILFFKMQLNEEACQKLKQVMKNLYLCHQENDEYLDLLIKGYVFQIYYLLSKLIDNKYQKEIASNQNYLNLSKILDFIDLNYSKNLTLELVAKEFNYSISYITKTFKKFSNTTFKEYLTLVRLINSEILLINSKKTINEIATNVGFPNIKAFGKAFKDRYQVTPQQYRKVYQNLA